MSELPGMIALQPANMICLGARLRFTRCSRALANVRSLAERAVKIDQRVSTEVSRDTVIRPFLFCRLSLKDLVTISALGAISNLHLMRF